MSAPTVGCDSPRRHQRGAALLLAMLILTLVSTLAAGMVWQQARAVQVEAAERARAQSAWILNGALDWARLILREDARSGGADHLGEPWAVPLAEARLSTFLAADRDNNADSGPEAFLSGAIVDAQSRYNLRNLVGADGKLVPVELATLDRLCQSAGLGRDLAERLATALRSAWVPSAEAGDGGAPLAPRDVGQLRWLGLDAAAVARLAPYVMLLPVRTTVNVNTASREVLVAVLDGLDLASAERLLAQRERHPLRTLAELRAQLPESVAIDVARVGVASSYFEVSGRLRLEDRVLEERSLVERRGVETLTLRRERHSLAPALTSAQRQ